MKIPIKLLSQFIDLNCGIDKIIDILPKIGFEVESVSYGNRFIITQILDIKVHEKSDKLKICKVVHNIKNDSIDNIQNTLEIVCGADNTKVGLKTVLALEGAIIPNNQMEIKHTQIAGVKSYGMLCSEKELGISDIESGIIELNDNSELGKPFFDDIIDINITPNRGDCLGIIGIARELAAKNLGSLKDLTNIDFQNFNNTQNNKNALIINRIDGSKAVALIKITDIPSDRKTPKIIKEFLLNSGIALTNEPIVNIINYVTLIFNQPMHAYDTKKVYGNDITFKIYKNEYKEEIKDNIFKALNGEDYIVEENDIIVLDGKNNIIALGGIIGSDSTKCDDTTDSVILESAHFSHINIANTSRRLSINSDAKYRFERGIDISMNVYALKFCTNLLIQNFGCKIECMTYSFDEKIISKEKYLGYQAHIINIGINEITKSNVIFSDPYIQFNKIINNIDVKRVCEFLGYQIRFYEIYNILVSLGFYIFKDVSRRQIITHDIKELDNFSVIVPFWRNDVDSFMDIIEEIARINGYENIPISPPNFVISEIIDDFKFNTKKNIRSLLLSLGLKEILNLSFISSKKEFIENTPQFMIKNPINKNFDIMRPSLLFGLLDVINHNMKYQNKDLALFEYGPIYKDIKEKGTNSVAGIFHGNIINRNIHEDIKKADFFYLKKIVENILTTLYIDSYKISTCQLPKYFHPNIGASISLGKTIIGYFGELHPKINNNKSMFFEIFLDYLPKRTAKKFSMHFSRYPLVKRDFAFIFDKQPIYQELKSTILSLNKKNNNIIREIILFDIYKMDNKSSIAFELSLQSDTHTLSSEEIEEISNSVIYIITKNFSGILRKDYV